MPRANSSVPRHRRHRKIIKQAKGYYGARSRTFKSAKDAVVKAGLYAYRDRRQRKRMFRRLWITRINAGCRLNGTTYSAFINGLKVKGINLDRKILADIVVNDSNAFTALVKSIQ
ncbi:MAG: 50S ribosomal protein L20 [Candidatus Neomarinimicrobiota bacterium]